ncbi:MAG: hypothetical protein GY828_05585, partial [Candidatus Gracilibacteria bacterium]|nr:hypothetical protein [Candidatus Gracilibacteria bacterium]
EFALRDIVPLNIIGLFIGVQTMYKVSDFEKINHTSQSFFTSEIFSAILFFMIAIFFLWSIVISSKYFEKEDEGYVTFSYVSIILWLIYNLGLLETLSSETKSLFYIIFSAILFYAWHYLRTVKTQYQHVSLYSGAVLCATIAFLQLIPELNIYSSIVIAYSSVIFGVLYYIDSSKTERLFTYGFLSLLGALLSIILVYDSEIVLRFSTTIYVVLALTPAMFGYFLSQKSKNDKYIETSKITSITAGFIASMFVFVDIIEYLDYGLILFYILPLTSLIYIKMSKYVFDDTMQLVLRFSIVVMLIGYFGIFLKLLGNIHQPINIEFFTNYNFLSDVI